ESDAPALSPATASRAVSAPISRAFAVARHARSKNIALKAQGLLYPVCDLSKTYASEAEFARTPPISTDVLDYFWGHFLGPSRTPELLRDLRLSPMLDPDLSGLPPAFVLTAGLDPLRDEGEAFAERLIAAGIETQYFCVTGTIHGFLRMGKLIPSVEDTLKAAGTFLGRQLVSEAA
ncbi:MAG: alpha/beta hydrolase fold domain-containing protein, partial [Pseudomonadota bacterium]